MKLLYTDVRSSLTEILTKEAEKLVRDGKWVFYIAPNSLSFEKEREVLGYLSQKASFDITVTRFTQMARYLILNDVRQEETLDDTGLGMVFYKCLSEIEPKDLRVFASLAQDTQFIQQLIELYHELAGAQMSFLDLEALEDEDKKVDLLLIFEKVTAFLNKHQLVQKTPLSELIEAIETDRVESDFERLAVVVDGFTRFSAEEEHLVDMLHRKGVEVVIGVYASKKAYHTTFREGNLYQASMEFLQDLAYRYQVPAENRTKEEMDTFQKASRLLESRYDFSDLSLPIEERDLEQLQIWSCLSQKEELELVARSIRQELQGDSSLRYKDFRVLLGDVASYQLSLQTIFDQYQIPFYLGRSESMATHPLTQFVDSIWRLKRYRFQQEDLINLLKTGLYTDLSVEEVDVFEQYIRYLGIHGLKAFQTEFTKSHQEKFSLEKLNAIRERVISPLSSLFASRTQKAEQLLAKWGDFLTQVSLQECLGALVAELEPAEQERHTEAWKAFCHILEQFMLVFSKSQVSLDSFLNLLLSGMTFSNFRTVPATVDTVLVQSYDLISPLRADYVYAIGLTQEHLPKIAQNQGLLSDEEKEDLNQASFEGARLLVPSKENLKKNRYAMVSLLNSAHKKLVLSAPDLLNEAESDQSIYLKELKELGFKGVNKQLHRGQLNLEDIASYQSLLSSLIAYHQLGGHEQEDQELTFVTVLARVMGKKLAEQGLENPILTKERRSKPLSQATLDALYPKTEPFYLSTSGLTEFYRHEYSYFLRYVLGLQDELRLRPNALSHGNFLHRIFEHTLKDRDGKGFDQRLEEAIRQTSQEQEFAAIYQANLEGQLTREILLDVARYTAGILATNDRIETIQEEMSFGGAHQAFVQLDGGRQVFVRGKVDRVDRLLTTGSLGVVDYKSRLTQFQFAPFFNGLHSQLPTYLAALKKEGQSQFFGAMYLEMADPVFSLSKVKDLAGAVAEANKTMKYQGLFLQDEISQLSDVYNKNKAYQLKEEELELLLDYNALLYKKAAEKILSGQFAINPYTEDGKSIATVVNQHQAITGFEANLHLGQARKSDKLELVDGKRVVGEKLKEAWLEKMREELRR